jgi:hypothetical protein
LGRFTADCGAPLHWLTRGLISKHPSPSQKETESGRMARSDRSCRQWLRAPDLSRTLRVAQTKMNQQRRKTTVNTIQTWKCLSRSETSRSAIPPLLPPIIQGNAKSSAAKRVLYGHTSRLLCFPLLPCCIRAGKRHPPLEAPAPQALMKQKTITPLQRRLRTHSCREVPSGSPTLRRSRANFVFI